VIKGAVAFLQTAVVPEIIAVGKGFTVIVAFPGCGCEHAVELPSWTLNRLYVKIPTTFVGAVIVILFPLVVVIN